MSRAEGKKVPAWRAPLIVGIVLLLLATVTMVDAYRLAATTGPGVGPSAPMKLIAGLLAILGAWHLVTAVRSLGLRTGQEWGGVRHPRNLAWVLGGLVGQIVALWIGAGFIIASTILFVATAKGFGRSLKSRGLAYGVILTTVVFFFFTQALSLALPSGPLEKLLFG